MQFQKLSPEQCRIIKWRAKRNRIVQQILTADPYISRQNALKLANKRAGRMPK